MGRTPEAHLATNKRYRDRVKGELRSFKLEHGCSVCGYKISAAALDFHHLDPSEKRAINGHTILTTGRRDELAMCELLCSNCHREEHELPRKRVHRVFVEIDGILQSTQVLLVQDLRIPIHIALGAFESASQEELDELIQDLQAERARR